MSTFHFGEQKGIQVSSYNIPAPALEIAISPNKPVSFTEEWYMEAELQV